MATTLQTITLCFLRDDGIMERVHLTHHTLSEAREVAESVLRCGAGLYSQVEIHEADRLIEILENTFA
jgi:hypothetical protein